MKTSKKILLSTAGLVFTMAIVGCTKSCSNLGKNQQDTQQDQQQAERPSYGGINVKRVVKRDLTQGEGAELKSGQTAVYKHTAWIYDPKALANKGVQIEGGTEATAETQIGSGNIIKGFSDGMIGMKAGGKRQLIIPPELAYGDKGMEPHVFPGAIILVEVELVQIK